MITVDSITSYDPSDDLAEPLGALGSAAITAIAFIGPAHTGAALINSDGLCAYLHGFASLKALTDRLAAEGVTLGIVEERIDPAPWAAGA